MSTQKSSAGVMNWSTAEVIIETRVDALIVLGVNVVTVFKEEAVAVLGRQYGAGNKRRRRCVTEYGQCRDGGV
jgi:hypothetical protein